MDVVADDRKLILERRSRLRRFSGGQPEFERRQDGQQKHAQGERAAAPRFAAGVAGPHGRHQQGQGQYGRGRREQRCPRDRDADVQPGVIDEVENHEQQQAGA